MSDLISTKLKLRPALVTFLAHVDEIHYVPEIGLAATMLHKGKLTLMLGEVFQAVSDQAKVEILSHECGHFLMAHIPRRGDRDPQRWNVVIDASLHASGVCDWELVDQEVRAWAAKTGQDRYRDFSSCIFEKILDKDTGEPLFPMPPEMAYDRLPDVPVICGQCSGDDDGHSHSPTQTEGCGSVKNSTVEDDIQSILKRALASERIGKADQDFVKQLSRALQGGLGSGGARDMPDLPAPKQWIRKTLQFLIYARRRGMRERSWRREHRSFPDLPGKVRQFARGGLFLLDASGSIGPDELGVFLSAVINTPELSGSDVVIFDGKWTNPIPVTSTKEIINAVKTMGGGTAIRGVGQAFKDDPRPRVWITDGYTGDGWPDKRNAADVWCVWNNGPAPDYASAKINIE